MQSCESPGISVVRYWGFNARSSSMLMSHVAAICSILTFFFNSSVSVACGSVVPCDDVDALEREIKRVCSEHPYSKEACMKRAQAFDRNERFEEYVRLYEGLGEANWVKK